MPSRSCGSLAHTVVHAARYTAPRKKQVTAFAQDRQGCLKCNVRSIWDSLLFIGHEGENKQSVLFCAMISDIMTHYIDRYPAFCTAFALFHDLGKLSRKA